MNTGNAMEFEFDKGAECYGLEFFSIDARKKGEWLKLEATQKTVPLRDRVLLYLSSCETAIKSAHTFSIWRDIVQEFSVHFATRGERIEIFHLVSELTEQVGEVEGQYRKGRINTDKIARELKKVILRHANGLGFELPKHSGSVVNDCQKDVNELISDSNLPLIPRGTL